MGSTFVQLFCVRGGPFLQPCGEGKAVRFRLREAGV
jgi:hypothetical protein